MNKPLVSVIISTYNRPNFLWRAITSVQNQTLKDIEIIVVDDHSLNPPTLPSDKRIVAIRMPYNTGFWIRPRNVGLMVAKSDYIAFLDDDNVYLPNHLEVLYKAIKDNQADMVYGDREYKSVNPKETRFMGRMSFDFDLKKLNKGNYIDISDMMVTMQMMNKIGFFDINWNRKADWLFAYKLGKNLARVGHVKEVITEYWWHDSNIGQQNPLGGKFIHK